VKNIHLAMFFTIDRLNVENSEVTAIPFHTDAGKLFTQSFPEIHNDCSAAFFDGCLIAKY